MGKFQFEQVTFDSDFDAGNLDRVEESDGSFRLWVRHDQPDKTMSSWFYFKVEAAPGTELALKVVNLGRNLGILKFGMRPVVKTLQHDWQRLETIDWCKGEAGSEIHWNYVCAESVAWFAFTYPWSYADDLQYLDSLNPGPLYFYRGTLAHSVEGRKSEVLVISSPDGGDVPTAYGWTSFPNKQMVVVSSRVHPGETPSSYMLKGLVDYLLSPVALPALERFVFVIVPMLNPDGVYHGHMRFDTLGQNLNRCYADPDPETQPTIHALKALIVHFAEQVYAFIDLHAHIVVKGIFVFGNFMNDFRKQVDACLLPRLMTTHDPNFHWRSCDFSEASMRAADKRGESKEGCGRVAIFQAAGISRCYTLESNYHSGVIVNDLENHTEVESIGEPAYTPHIFEHTGRSLVVSLLESLDVPAEFRVKVAQDVAQVVPYRYYNDIRKLGKSTEAMQKFLLSEETS